jgi:hypothetical protein
MAEAAAEIHGLAVLAEVGNVHLPRPEGAPDPLDDITRAALESLLESPVRCWTSDVGCILRCIPAGGGRYPYSSAGENLHLTSEQAVLILSAVPEEVGGWVPPSDLVDAAVLVAAYRDHSLPLLSWAADRIRSTGHRLLGIVAAGPKEVPEKEPEVPVSAAVVPPVEARPRDIKKPPADTRPPVVERPVIETPPSVEERPPVETHLPPSPPPSPPPVVRPPTPERPVLPPEKPAAPPEKPALPPERPTPPPEKPALPSERPAAPPEKPALPPERPAAPPEKPALPPERPAPPPERPALPPEKPVPPPQEPVVPPVASGLRPEGPAKKKPSRRKVQPPPPEEKAPLPPAKLEKEPVAAAEVDESESDGVSVKWAARYGTRPSLRRTFGLRLRTIIPWIVVLGIAFLFTYWKIGPRLLQSGTGRKEPPRRAEIAAERPADAERDMQAVTPEDSGGDQTIPPVQPDPGGIEPPSSTEAGPEETQEAVEPGAEDSALTGAEDDVDEEARRKVDEIVEEALRGAEDIVEEVPQRVEDVVEEVPQRVEDTEVTGDAPPAGTVEAETSPDDMGEEPAPAEEIPPEPETVTPAVTPSVEPAESPGEPIRDDEEAEGIVETPEEDAGTDESATPEEPREDTPWAQRRLPSQIPSEETERPEEPQAEPPRRVGTWGVQVAAFQEGERALLRVRELAGLGFSADTVWVRIPDRGRWCRVIVGAYLEQARAESVAAVLRQHPDVSAGFVVSRGGR